MKRLLIFTMFAFIINIECSASPPLQAYLSYSAFYNPEAGPYIETYLLFNTNTCKFKKEADGKYHANISAIIIIKKDTIIQNLKKFAVTSPVLDDTTLLKDNFIDIQRFVLPNGRYQMEIMLTDNNLSKKAIKSKINVTLNFPEKTVSLSDIQLVNSYSIAKEQNILTKSGYDIIPHVLSFYPGSEKQLKFYTEIYNTNSEVVNSKNIFIKYYIQSFEKKLPVEGFVRQKKETSQQVIAVLSEFNIEELPAGNYNLVVEARDNKNILINSCSLFFQRSNPEYKIKHIDISNVNVDNTFAGLITNETLLNEYLDALYPISSNNDYEFISKQLMKTDIKTKQQYFYNFWLDRDHVNPEKAWTNYLQELNKVNNSFKCPNRKGYQTERGRIYLQYGEPNTIYSNENEPSAYPYEIWQYYSIKNQTNAKFIFYLRDLVSNCYDLLNSNVEGEVHNAQWQIVLYGRDTYPDNIDEEKPTDHWGGKAGDYYKLPR